MLSNYKNDKSNCWFSDDNIIYDMAKHNRSYNYRYCNGDDDFYRPCCEHEDLSISENCFDEGVGD